MVQGKDRSDPFSLGHTDQCSIGKVHREVPIFFHQCLHPGYVLLFQRQNPYDPGFDPFPERFLGRPGKIQKIHCLCKYWPHGHHLRSDLLKRFSTPCVMHIIPMQKCNQWAGVNQHHIHDLVLSRRCSAKRCPVRSDRSGGPPTPQPKLGDINSKWVLECPVSSACCTMVIRASRMISDLVCPRRFSRRLTRASVCMSNRTLVGMAPPFFDRKSVLEGKRGD